MTMQIEGMKVEEVYHPGPCLQEWAALVTLNAGAWFFLLNPFLSHLMKSDML